MPRLDVPVIVPELVTMTLPALRMPLWALVMLALLSLNTVPKPMLIPARVPVTMLPEETVTLTLVSTPLP